MYQVNEKGYYGNFGGAFIPEMLYPNVEELREKYLQAEIGVTGANFLVADVGGIAVTENEGNARLSCAWPKTHIVVAAIEKMINARCQ